VGEVVPGTGRRVVPGTGRRVAPGPPRPPRVHRRPGVGSGRTRALALALVVALALGGCSLLSGLVRTTGALEDAGFAHATVDDATNGRSAVTVGVDQRPAGGTLAAQSAAVAAVVWRNLPGYFDTLTVDVRGLGVTTFTHAELLRRLGPRPADLDAQTIASEVGHQGAVVLFGVIGLLVVVLGAVLVVWGSARRGRRRRQARHMAHVMATLPPEMWGLEGTGAGPGWVAAGPGSVPPLPPVPSAGPGDGARGAQRAGSPPAPGPPAPGPPAPGSPGPGHGARAPSEDC